MSGFGTVLSVAQLEMAVYTYLRDKELELIKNDWIRTNESNISNRRGRVKELVKAYLVATKQQVPFDVYSILGQYPVLAGRDSLSEEFRKRATGAYINTHFGKVNYDELTHYEKLLVAIRALEVMAFYEDTLLRHKMDQLQTNYKLGDHISGVFLGSGAYEGLNNIDEYKNITKYAFDSKKKVHTVVYTGSLFKWKGVYTLVDSMKYVLSDIKLVIIGGSGDYLIELNQYIEKNELKNIEIIPHIPKKETLSYLQNSDAVILPNSAKDKMSLYTSPIKMFEYMASNRPIVASNLPSLCEVLTNEKNAILCEPDHPIDLASKIDFVLGTDCSSIVNQALDDVLEYTWEKRAKNIKEFMLG